MTYDFYLTPFRIKLFSDVVPHARRRWLTSVSDEGKKTRRKENEAETKDKKSSGALEEP